MEPSSATPGEETVSRILDPQFSFADLELKRQGVQLDPTLRGIAEFLDQHSALAEKVRLDDARALLRQVFQTDADLTPDMAANTLTVRLHHLTHAAHDQAIEKLLADLNATRTVFPGTQLTLVFKLGSA